MNKDVLSLDDLSRESGVPSESLTEWTETKLLQAGRFCSTARPLCSPPPASIVSPISNDWPTSATAPRRFLKIIKKVGLPRDGHGRKHAPHKDRFLTVGQLAEAGVSPRTIKHWEDMGIIGPEMRSEGGFRLYPQVYVYLCHLIKDLQVFGYSLEEIKTISDYFRDFLTVSAHPETLSRKETQGRLEVMLREIDILLEKMELIKKGSPAGTTCSGRKRRKSSS